LQEDVVAYGCELLGIRPPPVVPFEEASKTMSAMALSFWGESRKVISKRLKVSWGGGCFKNIRMGIGLTKEQLGNLIIIKQSGSEFMGDLYASGAGPDHAICILATSAYMLIRIVAAILVCTISGYLRCSPDLSCAFPNHVSGATTPCRMSSDTRSATLHIARA
jgi:hypothetical protein